MARSAVGMEINQRNIHVVGLKRGRRGPMMNGHASVSLPEGAVTRTGVADALAFKRAVVQALETARSGRANLCLSICSDHVDARHLRMPLMPERERRRAIGWEIRQYVPFPVGSEEDIVFDYQVLNGDGTEEHDLLVISAPGRLVYEYIEPLQENRIFPEMIDMGAYSLPWAVLGEGGIGYVHIGPEFVHLLLMRDGTYQLSRQVPVPVGPLLDAVPVVGGLSALADGDNDTSGAGRAVRELLSAITQTLEFFRVEARAHELTEQVQRLVVSGDGAAVPGMPGLIEQATGLPTERAEPAIGPGVSGFAAEEAARYAVAVGLAQRGLAEL